MSTTSGGIQTPKSAIVVAVVAAVALVAVLSSPASVSAHEPLFGPGPHTMTEGTVAGMGSVNHRRSVEGTDTTELMLGGMYAVTTYFNLNIAAPYIIQHGDEEAETVHGIGDPTVQATWRAWTNLGKGYVDALSFMGGVTLPGGDPDISHGNSTYTLGMTAGREHLRYYLFGGLQYMINTPGLEGRPGNTVMYDAAVGFRPYIPEFDGLDTVFLFEFNGMTMADAEMPQGSDDHDQLYTELQSARMRSMDDDVRQIQQAHAAMPTAGAAAMADGGTELAVTPTTLLAWGPAMLKLGVQFPLYDTHPNPEQRPDVRFRADLILQH